MLVARGPFPPGCSSNSTACTFLETHEIKILKVRTMEKDLLSTLGADESEPTVADNSLNPSFHNSPRLSAVISSRFPCLARMAIRVSDTPSAKKLVSTLQRLALRHVLAGLQRSACL